MLKNVAVGSLLMIFSFFSYAEKVIPAPIGLSWGMTKEQVKSSVSSIKVLKRDGRISLLQIQNPFKTVPGMDYYHVMIDEKYGLVKVIINKDISGDSYGIEGTKVYQEYKKILSDKYGKPTDSYEFMWKDVFKDKNEFYQCLKYDGCGSMVSFIGPKDSGIMIELKGYSRGEGMLNIIYFAPDLPAALKEREAEKSSAATDAL